MKQLTPSLLKLLTFIGLFCMAVPVSILGLWIHAFNSGNSQSERVSKFNTYFPDFLHGIYSTTLLSLAFCAVAIVISIAGIKLPAKLWKFINIFVLVISIFLFLLNLFSLM